VRLGGGGRKSFLVNLPVGRDGLIKSQGVWGTSKTAEENSQRERPTRVEKKKG